MEKWIETKESHNYEVSTEGRVKNAKTGRILKPRKAGKGYQKVTLCDETGHHDHYIHRLVADNFSDGGSKELEVNHKDGNKKNNHISNLEWCTRLENVRHAIKTGLATPYVGMPGTPIRIIETGEVYSSIRECARSIGGNHQHVIDCLAGRARSHKGYHFEYA